MPLEDARLMVPIIYPKDMKVTPCYDTGNKKSLFSMMSNISQNIKHQVDVEIREEERKYHKPSDKVRSRLKSEHLSFL